MTTGQLLSSMSSVSNVSAIVHLQNIIGGTGEIQVVRIKSYKVTVEPKPTNVYVKAPSYKLTFPTTSYKVVYQPQAKSATRVADNVTIKKGC